MPSISLPVIGTLKKCKKFKDALEITHEINKLIKYSPHRESIFKEEFHLAACQESEFYAQLDGLSNLILLQAFYAILRVYKAHGMKLLCLHMTLKPRKEFRALQFK